MTRIGFVAAVLAGTACSGDEPKGSAPADGDADTDTDTDTDADTDADADADTDADTDPTGVQILTEGYGHTAAEWGTIWWNWMYSFSPDQSPVLDTTAICALHQTEEVWFLAGNYGGTSHRACTVPADKPLFFPTDTTEFDQGPLGTYATYDAEWLADYADLYVAGAEDRWLEIDGVRWDRDALEPYDGEAQIFVLTVPDIDPNMLDWLGYDHFVGDIDPAVADGVWILLDPLPVGSHTVAFHAQHQSWVLDVTYDLTVE